MAPLGGGETFFYRLNCRQYHTILLLSDQVIIHETTAGPFIKSESEFGPFSPDPDDMAAVTAFLSTISEK